MARDGGGTEGQVFAQLAELVARYDEASLILIDIPIGLFDAGDRPRQCDAEARRLLRRPRAASVFPVPLRPALAAGDREAASRLNVAAAGGGIGAHQFALFPKIAEADRLLRELAAAGRRGPAIRECHPEVCFWALNHHRPMVAGKKTPEGVKERAAVLRHLVADFDHVLAPLREQLGRSRDGLNRERPRAERIRFQADDVLDAFVAAVTAERCVARQLFTLPVQPPLDALGLRMEMVYWPRPVDSANG